MKAFMRISLWAVGLTLATALAVAPAKAQFSGCGAGVFGEGIIGNAEFGGPPSISMTGTKYGVSGECGFKYSMLYIGLGAEYSWFQGDLEKLGVQNDLTLYSRGGIILDRTLWYAHGGWTQLKTAGPKIDGIKLGVGVEQKLLSTPLYWDLRYTYAVYDETDVSPSLAGIDLTSHSIRLGMSLKFGPGMFGGSGPIFVNEDHNTPQGCDPKIDRGCKR